VYKRQGNMFFAANGARFGFWSTMSANIGYHLATWVAAVAVGFGFIKALDRFPEVFLALKWLGAAYVLWIAWKLFRSGVLEGNETAKSITFFDGVVLLVLNPKAYIIIVLMFTQFLGEATGDTLVAVLLISTIFTFNNFIAFWMLFT